MRDIQFYSGERIPLEMHKVRIVQKLFLLPIEERLKKMQEAGNNTFLLKNRDVFMDMLTDSGVNAMSDRQQSAMLIADDSYAGSETFTRLEKVVNDLFGTKYFLPTHQGRACENIISQAFVQEGQTVITNYHFTTTKAHILRNGGELVEALADESLEVTSDLKFKGNMDLKILEDTIKERGAENIAFVRMEAGTNLIGGQPFSLQNMKDVRAICDKYGVMLLMDASLLGDNLYFIKVREEACEDMSIREITQEIASCCDLIYFSARKLGSARGGAICSNSLDHFMASRELLTLYEGFLTYGGMSVREMEAIAVGLEETMDFDNIRQGPEFIKYMSDELIKAGVPVVTPAGGLGCHIDAMKFLSHLPQSDYPAGALASAVYIVSGARGMERGTLSEERNPDGTENYSNMELLRMAMPRRVFTLSQVKYVIDRIIWLYDNRELIGGLEFTDEPSTLRFFLGSLKAKGDWQEKLVAKFREDFPDSL